MKTQPHIGLKPFKTTPTPTLPARAAAAFVRLYQLTLSPLKYALFGPSCGCRFEPTCSTYARQALLKHGFFRGTGLAIYRILRCHPWHRGGFDPVPSLKSPRQNDMQEHSTY